MILEIIEGILLVGERGIMSGRVVGLLCTLGSVGWTAMSPSFTILGYSRNLLYLLISAWMNKVENME